MHNEDGSAAEDRRPTRGNICISNESQEVNRIQKV